MPTPMPTISSGAESTHPTCTSIDWFAEGQVRVVAVDGVKVTVRFVGRKGRRARIAIDAPAGAVFGGESTPVGVSAR